MNWFVKTWMQFAFIESRQICLVNCKRWPTPWKTYDVSISQRRKEKSRFILKYKMGVCGLASSTNKVVIFHNITDILYSCIPILNYVNLWIYLLYLNHIIKSILYSYESICFFGIHIKCNWFHECTLCVYLTVGGKSTGVQEY